MAPSTIYARKPLLNADSDAHLQLIARSVITRSVSDDQPADTDNKPDNKVTIALLVLGILALVTILVSGFFTYRRYQRNKQLQRDNALADYQEAKLGMYESTANLNGLTIAAKHDGRSSTIFIRRDSNPMLANPDSPPNSPDNVPEIHITVPEEIDEKGHAQGPRVLVVRVGDNATVGLEPMNDEQLPPYQQEDKNGFYSVDMDQIGGLKEKNRTQFL